MSTKTKEKGQPASSSSRLEKSRKLAQKRRETYKDLMAGIMESLPFSREVLAQLDYNSRLRLGLCFLKMKKLLEEPETGSPKMIEAPPTNTATGSSSNTVVFQPGVLQELMIEAMDGFLMVLLSDGNIVYLSESIQKHMGLFQSEHMGTSLYDLVPEEDHTNVKLALSSAEVKAHTRIGTKRVNVPCSFFCRMRCSRNKVANTQSKSPGFKVVHTSGYFQLHGSEAYLVALVKPVTPPSILEIRMEGNMFVTHYALDMKCTFFDGRLRHLMGYRKEDLKDKLVFDFHHHDDTEATLECSKGIQVRGEGMSGYYRMLTKDGQFVWLQTRATMMFDSHTGNPSYIVCMNFIINKEKGLQSLESKALPPPETDTKPETFISEEKSKAHDPFPIPREDGKMVNPLSEEDPADHLPHSSTPPTTSGSPEEKKTVKLEVESLPDVPLATEEPSSTTSPRPLLGGGASNVSSLGDRGRLHDDADSAPSSGGASGGASGESGCVPDSTSATKTSPDDVIVGVVESGYNSRIESASSLLKNRSDSTRPGSTSSAGVILIPDGLGEPFTSGSRSSPILSFLGSGSNVLESDSSIHQDPVIQEIETNSEPQRSQQAPQHQRKVYQQQPQQLQQRTTEIPQQYHSGQQAPNVVYQTQPVGYNGSQQQQPMTYHSGHTTGYQSGQQQQPQMNQSGQQQQPQMYQSGQQQPPLGYQSGQQQQPQTNQSGQQQQPQMYQSGQQAQPLGYQSGQQQQAQMYQSGPPLGYQSGQQQQPQMYQSGQQQQPLGYQSGQQQQPQMYQSGQQAQPLGYQSGQQQQTQMYQSGQQAQPLEYQSGQPQMYQSGQPQQPTQPILNQSGQQQPLAYHSGQQQQPEEPITYQQQQFGYQATLSHTHPMMPHPPTVSQQPPVVKQEMQLRRYSNPLQTGTGTSWQGNGMGTQQYGYQTPQQPYHLHHESNTSLPPSLPLQHIPGDFDPAQQFATPPSHTQNVGVPHTMSDQNPVPTGLNPHTLPLFSSLGQQPRPSGDHTHFPMQFLPAVGVAEQVGGASGVGRAASSVPLLQPQPNMPTPSLGVDGHVTGHVTSHVTPDVVSHVTPHQGNVTPDVVNLTSHVTPHQGNVTSHVTQHQGNVTSHVTPHQGHVTPNLVNLTGEDLQMLDFIDQLDTNTGGGGGGGYTDQLTS